jgi:hypothetical protein
MPCVTFSVVHHRDWALVRASTCRRRPKSLDGVHGGQWRCVLTLRTCRVEENNATDDGDLLGPIERGVHRVAVHVQIVGYLRNGIRRMTTPAEGISSGARRRTRPRRCCWARSLILVAMSLALVSSSGRCSAGGGRGMACMWREYHSSLGLMTRGCRYRTRLHLSATAPSKLLSRSAGSSSPETGPSFLCSSTESKHRTQELQVSETWRALRLQCLVSCRAAWYACGVQ